MAEAKKDELEQSSAAVNVEGWPPDVLGEDGEIYTPEGIHVTPNHFIGAERWHKLMFIDYERTFGRGLAKVETHTEQNDDHSKANLERKYGVGYGGLQDVYRSISKEYTIVMNGSNSQGGEEIGRRLQDFRNKYPKLYSDVPQVVNQNPEFKIV